MRSDNYSGNPEGESVYITKAEVEEMINEKLAYIKIYVSESDITQAQESIRAIVEQAEF